jgi:DNA-binding NarL/FixJ family response regulator
MTTKNILIVDDQHEVRRVLRSGIESLGTKFKVMDLPSAEEAMLVLFRHRVDLLIVDFRLPGISGLEFMDKVRRRNPDVRVIMITGVQDRQIKRRIAEAGAFAFFLKPVHMTEFLNAVQNALGSSLEAVPTIQEKPEQTQEPAGEIVSLLQATPTKFNPTHYLQRILVETKAASAALINENGEISHHYGELLLSTEKEAVWKQIVGLILNGKTLVDSFRSSQNDFILSLSSLAWTMTEGFAFLGKIVIQFSAHFYEPRLGAWCNGSTADFGSVYSGSNPDAPALLSEWFVSVLSKTLLYLE